MPGETIRSAFKTTLGLYYHKKKYRDINMVFGIEVCIVYWLVEALSASENMKMVQEE